jgi:hypothetical protein
MPSDTRNPMKFGRIREVGRANNKWKNYAAPMIMPIQQAIAAGIHEELEKRGFLVEDCSDFAEIGILSEKYEIDGSPAPILILECVPDCIRLLDSDNEIVARVDYESPTMMEQIVDLVKYWRKKAERPYL